MIFSVIIPAFDANDTIDRCLASLESQSMSDFEVLVISDDQNDYSKGRNFKNFQLRQYKTKNLRSGPGAARNIGIQKSRGKYITFIDADDEVSQNRLSRFHYYLQKEHLVSDFPNIINEDTGRSFKKKHLENKNLNITDFLKLNFPLKIAHRNTKELFFDDRIKFAEDTLYNAEAIIKFRKGIYISDDTEYKYYIRNSSLTAQSFEYIDSQYQELIKILAQSKDHNDAQRLITKHFWFKREINRVYQNFTQNFGSIDFQTFASEFF